MLYEIARPLLFSLDAETAHETALAGLNVAGRLLPAGKPLPARPVNVMGLGFPNRIGMAAGALAIARRLTDRLPKLARGYLTTPSRQAQDRGWGVLREHVSPSAWKNGFDYAKAGFGIGTV